MIQIRLHALMTGCALAAALATGCARHDGPLDHDTPTSPVERPFQAGGELRLRLSAGEYSVTGSADSRIAVSWRTRYPADAASVRVQVQTEGTRGVIDTDGPSNGFHVEIAVPARTHLQVKLTAGDLAIDGIEGDLDVSALAGDLSIGVADPAFYESVHASVTAGEISARPFNRSQGGLFRNMSWTGPGGYSIRARLMAGNLVLRAGSAASE